MDDGPMPERRRWTLAARQTALSARYEGIDFQLE